MEIIRPGTTVDFMSIRRTSVIISMAFLVAAILSFAVRGLNYAQDFTGGTLVELEYKSAANTDQIRESLEKAGYSSPVVQTMGQQNLISVRLRVEEGKTNSDQTADTVLNLLQTADNPAKVTRSSFIGSQVGSEIVENGIVAIVFVALGFMLYVTIRFEWKFALAAIATTLHDVIVVTGIFSLFQMEFDLNVFAGILSVMGYSINDTIVVFDRVRDNFRSMHHAEPVEVMNRSVNETLSRTIITSFVALLTVVALYLFGGSSLQGMAFSQICGIIIGTLSSIYFACPLLLMLGVNKLDLMKGREADPEASAAEQP
jgi:preprotein translocase subunit SecF